MYVMIESTMQFDDIGVIPGLLPVFLMWFKVKNAVRKVEREKNWG